MWCHVGIVRTGILEERMASISRVDSTHELGTTSASYCWRSQLTDTFHPEDVGDILLCNVRPTRRHNPENGFLQSVKYLQKIDTAHWEMHSNPLLAVPGNSMDIPASGPCCGKSAARMGLWYPDSEAIDNSDYKLWKFAHEFRYSTIYISNVNSAKHNTQA
jgi:hypothetical protein